MCDLDARDFRELVVQERLRDGVDSASDRISDPEDVVGERADMERIVKLLVRRHELAAQRNGQRHVNAVVYGSPWQGNVKGGLE